jgi:uncharacterized repeat protein (TIGR01451 family)
MKHSQKVVSKALGKKMMKKPLSTLWIAAMLFLHFSGILSAISLEYSISSAEAYEGHSLWKGDVAISMGEGPEGVAKLAPPGLDMFSDGSGGAFIAWEDHYWGSVMIQRINEDGQSLWGNNGFPIAPAEWYQLIPRMVSDGAGGVIVAWVDGRNGWCGPSFFAECEIYAQRIDASGKRLWQEGGVPICTAPSNQGTSGIAITSDGAGGAIIAWEDARPPKCCTVFSQRVNANGQTMWAPDGIPVVPEPTRMIGPIGAPKIVSDAEGGAIVAWLNWQVEPPPISVQRINEHGELLWPTKGIDVGFPAYTWFDVTSTGEGGGAIGFQIYEAEKYGISTQQVGANGQILWQAGGVPVAVDRHYRLNPKVISDGAGGVIITWEDERNKEASDNGNFDIYAQRVDATGQVLWQTNGIPICTAPYNQMKPRLIGDGLGGAIIAWQDCRNFPDISLCLFNRDLYAQRINATGQTLWRPDGIPVSVAIGSQGFDYGSDYTPGFVMSSDGDGGAILAWPDDRNYYANDYDVYAQRVNDRFAGPSADLSVSMTDSPDPIPLGKDLTYVVTVTNNGPEEATEVVLAHEWIGGDVAFISVTPSQGICFSNDTKNTVMCYLDPLPKGAATVITIIVTPMLAGMLTNTATLWGFESDPNMANNTTVTETRVYIQTPLIMTASYLPEGEVGAAYNGSLGISGGLPPYQTSVVAGSIPDGLSISPEGDIRGTPIKPGSKKFTARAIDQLAASVTKEFNVRIFGTLAITTRTLRKAKVGKNYSLTLNAKGGKKPYAWTLIGGSFPDGLSFDTATGRIAGTPTVSGNFDLAFLVSDSLGGMSRKDFTLVVD